MHTLVSEDLPQVHYLAGVELRKQVFLAIEVESRAHSDLLVIKMQPDQFLRLRTPYVVFEVVQPLELPVFYHEWVQVNRVRLQKFI